MDEQDDGDTQRLGSRKAPRRSVKLMVQARNGQQRLQAEAFDLSLTGIRIRTLNPLRAGTVYWLKIGNLESLDVTVMWVDDFVSGCRFNQPLHPAVYQSLLTSLGAE